PLWGREEHVRELFGAGVSELRFERRTVRYPASFGTAAALRDYYKANYGPTIAVYRAVAAEPERSAALDRDFEAFLARNDQRAPGAPVGAGTAEYLLVTAHKAGWRRTTNAHSTQTTQ